VATISVLIDGKLQLELRLGTMIIAGSSLSNVNSVINGVLFGVPDAL